MDYIYTALHQAHIDGTPILHPLWHKYPKDPNTFLIDLQFFFGDSILVSPVTEENSTSVSIYLPQDVFYDFLSLNPIHGNGTAVLLQDVNFTSIPVHIRGGTILPLRVQGAMTTTELRNTDFELVVAPGTDGQASGSLYVDDGISITPNATTEVTMTFKDNKLSVQSEFKYPTGVDVARVRFLGVLSEPRSVTVNGRTAAEHAVTFDSASKVLDVAVGLPFKNDLNIQFE